MITEAYAVVMETDSFSKLIKFENISLFTDLKEVTEKFYEHMTTLVDMTIESIDIDYDDLTQYKESLERKCDISSDFPCFSFHDCYGNHVFTTYIEKILIKIK